MRWFPGSLPALLFCELTWNFPATLVGNCTLCLAESFTLSLVVVFCPFVPSSVIGPLENLLVGEKCYCWYFLAWCNLEDFIKYILCNFPPLFTKVVSFCFKMFPWSWSLHRYWSECVTQNIYLAQRTSEIQRWILGARNSDPQWASRWQ